jgi:hypothetical protein
MKNTRRAFLRNYRQAPVEIRWYNSSACYQAQMNDCCRGGMRLATDQFFEPGSAVVIHARDLCDLFDDEAIRHGRPAEVVWCRRRAGSFTNQFSVGVQFFLTGESRPRPLMKSIETVET